MALADDLRRYRLDQRMTWQALAALLGMSPAGVWKIATGKSEARELTAHLIRSRLGWPDPEARTTTEGVGPEDQHGNAAGGTDREVVPDGHERTGQSDHPA